MKRWIGILTAAAALTIVAGCNKAQTGAAGAGLAGTAAGALIGAHSGHAAEGALIGAGAGVAGGYIVGNEMDKHDTNQRIDSVQQQANIQTINVRNSNGSYTPVTLQRSGANWVGPRGEVYPNLPTEEQLRRAYGF